MRHLDGRLIGEQEFGDHLARGLGAVGLGFDLHARRRGADAACRQHALALDLDHADATIAVRPVAGLRRVAQMWQINAEAARGAEDGLAFADIDVATVDRESLGRRRITFAGDFIDWRRVRHAGPAVAIGRAACGALIVVAVAGRFLPVAIAHHANLRSLNLAVTNVPAAFSVRPESILAHLTVD